MTYLLKIKSEFRIGGFLKWHYIFSQLTNKPKTKNRSTLISFGLGGWEKPTTQQPVTLCNERHINRTLSGKTIYTERESQSNLRKLSEVNEDENVRKIFQGL